MKKKIQKQSGFRKIIKAYVLFIPLILISLSFQNTLAATKTWVGNTIDWNTTSNWNPASLPSSTDDLIIPTSPSGGNMPTISSGSYTILSLNIQASAILTQTGGTILIKGGVGTISGTYNQSGGFFFIDNNMNVTINSGGQLNISGTSIFHLAKDAGTNATSSLVINGDVNLSGGNLDTKTFTIPAGKTVTQTGGTLFVKGGTGSISGNYNQSGGYFFIDNQPFTVNSGGQLNLSGSSTFRMAKDLTTNPAQTLTINGSLTQTSGVFAAKDVVIGSSAIYNSSNSTTNITGNLTNSGTLAIGGTSTNIGGDFTNAGTATLNGGTVNIAGNITNNASGDFTIAGATITSQNDATNFGIMSVSSGSLDLATAGKKLIIDGSTATRGIFNQYVGSIVKTDNLELKNNGTYNQFGGEVQIAHDLKVPAGSTFAATGGTVNYTGNAGAGADIQETYSFIILRLAVLAIPKLTQMKL